VRPGGAWWILVRPGEAWWLRSTHEEEAIEEPEPGLSQRVRRRRSSKQKCRRWQPGGPKAPSRAGGEAPGQAPGSAAQCLSLEVVRTRLDGALRTLV